MASWSEYSSTISERDVVVGLSGFYADETSFGVNDVGTRGLGRGSYGDVRKKCIDGVDVAEKQPTQRGAKAAENELQTLERIGEHPHVVKLLDWNPGVAGPTLRFEYAPDGSLVDFLKAQKEFCEAVAKAVALQLFAALAHVHSRGVAHFDVKGANILVFCNSDEAFTVKLADFGSAQCELPAQHQPAGTVAWMAPEALCWEGPESLAGTAADVWSAACVLLEVLSGGESPSLRYECLEQATYRQSQQPTAPSRFGQIESRSDITAACKAFLRLCFAIDPARRPSAADLLRHTWLQ